MTEVALIYDYILAHQQNEFKRKVSEQKDWPHYRLSLSLVTHAHRGRWEEG